MRAVIPEIDPAKCNGCGDCIEQCVSGAFTLVNGKVTIVRSEDCDYCADCETSCSSGAIRCAFEIVLEAES